METLAALLYKLEPIETGDLGVYEEAFAAKSYQEGEPYGFRSIFNDGTRLYATLVQRRVTLVPRFDLETESLVDDEVYVYAEIDFSIDARHQLLEVFGPLRNAPKVSAAVRPELEEDVRLSRIHLVPSEVMARLKESGLEVAVTRLNIGQFRHDEGVVGRFNATSVTEAFVERVLGQYDESIGRVRFDLVTDGGTVDVILSMAGQLRVTGDELAVEPAYTAIKTALFGEED